MRLSRYVTTVDGIDLPGHSFNAQLYLSTVRSKAGGGKPSDSLEVLNAIRNNDIGRFELISDRTFGDLEWRLYAVRNKIINPRILPNYPFGDLLRNPVPSQYWLLPSDRCEKGEIKIGRDLRDRPGARRSLRRALTSLRGPGPSAILIPLPRASVYNGSTSCSPPPEGEGRGATARFLSAPFGSQASQVEIRNRIWRMD